MILLDFHFHLNLHLPKILNFLRFLMVIVMNFLYSQKVLVNVVGHSLDFHHQLDSKFMTKVFS